MEAEQSASIDRQALEVYITDSLHIIEQNTERISGGSHHTKRFVEFLDGIRNPKPVETAEDIINRFNNTFLRNEENEAED